MATDVAGPRSRLFFLQDPESGVRYLVDTGAEVSVLPPEAHDLASTATSTLRAANGTPIRVFGRRSRTLNIGLRRQFRWIFLIADVQMPILGIDFLEHFDLLVDSRNRRLVDRRTSLTVNGILANMVPISPVYQAFTGEAYHDVLNQYSSVFRATPKLPPVTDATQHHIVTRGPPAFAKARRLPPDRLRVARAEFEHMLELGIIRPSGSP